ncbi:ribosome biogenesis protein SLX9 homolog [Oratosquilla oratoria]|uniref:ribosome biogenesis protein SLX9 homolog n=1 Tax=Oratosquilla oratoria TaxID=337810 RepID=UPI003F76D7C5
MGKVKRLREKYHNAVKKSKEVVEAEAGAGELVTAGLIPVVENVVPVEGGAQGDNIFGALKINLSPKKTDIEKMEDDSQNEDKMSTISSRQKSKEGNKKDRRKQRRMELLQKIEVVKAAEIAKQEKKRREKTVITGDLHPLMDALPSLEELLAKSAKQNSKKAPTSTKKKGMRKQKQEKKSMLEDINTFMAIQENDKYKEDPLAAVTEAVRTRVLEGLEHPP